MLQQDRRAAALCRQVWSSAEKLPEEKRLAVIAEALGCAMGPQFQFTVFSCGPRNGKVEASVYVFLCGQGYVSRRFGNGPADALVQSARQGILEVERALAPLIPGQWYEEVQKKPRKDGTKKTTKRQLTSVSKPRRTLYLVLDFRARTVLVCVRSDCTASLADGSVSVISASQVPWKKVVPTQLSWHERGSLARTTSVPSYKAAILGQPDPDDNR